MNNELRRLAAWPCIATAVVDGDEVANLKLDKPMNLMLSQAIRREDTTASWADAFMVRTDDVPRVILRTMTSVGKPVFAWRDGDAESLSDARAGCDRLQSDLAPDFDLAGYFVGRI